MELYLFFFAKNPERYWGEVIQGAFGLSVGKDESMATVCGRDPGPATPAAGMSASTGSPCQGDCMSPAAGHLSGEQL